MTNSCTHPLRDQPDLVDGAYVAHERARKQPLSNQWTWSIGTRDEETTVARLDEGPTTKDVDVGMARQSRHLVGRKCSSMICAPPVQRCYRGPPSPVSQYSKSIDYRACSQCSAKSQPTSRGARYIPLSTNPVRRAGPRNDGAIAALIAVGYAKATDPWATPYEARDLAREHGRILLFTREQGRTDNLIDRLYPYNRDRVRRHKIDSTTRSRD